MTPAAVEIRPGFFFLRYPIRFITGSHCTVGALNFDDSRGGKSPKHSCEKRAQEAREARNRSRYLLFSNDLERGSSRSFLSLAPVAFELNVERALGRKTENTIQEFSDSRISITCSLFYREAPGRTTTPRSQRTLIFFFFFLLARSLARRCRRTPRWSCLPRRRSKNPLNPSRTTRKTPTSFQRLPITRKEFFFTVFPVERLSSVPRARFPAESFEPTLPFVVQRDVHRE